MRTLFLVILPLALLSCKTNAPAQQTKATPSIPEVEVNRSHQPDKSLTDFKVKSWDVSGDTLIAVVAYSGGCEESSFKAIFTGGWMKSLPPKTAIYLEHHRVKPDPCREQITKTLKFDITKVRYETTKKVIVQTPNSKHSAVYEY
ncbi:MAG: hypothetical protein ACI9YU_001422 [Flavobacteriales bacterium]|jgi:hypothetical protein